MRRRLSTVAILTFFLYSLFAQGGTGRAVVNKSDGDRVATQKSEENDTESELVDIKARLVYPYKINDTLSVLCLVGNFAAQHNGAIITADSAVRYEDDRLECFGNVLINKNTTYAYADRADYDGERNLAALYSPLIKVVDENVTLYTYNFTFNTLNNVGYYWAGGVTVQRAAEPDKKDVVMESKRGYYYADSKQMVGVDEVELTGEGYELMGDSVAYEMEREYAYFYQNTNIWNDKGEYLYGDRGRYDKAQELYVVTKNGYMLTAEQEVWSDSLEYFRERQEAILRENIQIDDTTNKVLAFGDFAHYWREIEKVLLTRRPVVVNYDPKEVDSLFLRADTIMLLSYPVGTGPIVDSTEIYRLKELQERMKRATQSMKESQDGVVDSLAAALDEGAVVDSLADGHVHDEHCDHDHHDKTAWWKTLFSGGDSEKKAEKKAEKEAKQKAKTEEMERRQLARLDAENVREYRRLEVKSEKLQERIEKSVTKGRSVYADSVVLQRTLAQMGELDGSTLRKQRMLDSLAIIDSLRRLISDIQEEEEEIERDSLYRIIKSFRNVESYRSDFQMVCDSMVAISYDTVLRLYVKPILWSDNNQIVSNQADIYTRKGALDYADFFGDPIMSSQVIEGDTIHYNQVRGKTMRSFFRNNSVYRNDVDGYVETVYYLQDEETGEPNTVASIESTTATFYIENQTLDGVVYRNEPVYVFAPLDKKPEDLSLYLTDFKWYSDLRPTRNGVFDRTIRPSQREAKGALSRPEFPIQEKINSVRYRLTKGGNWVDRDDVVAPDAEEWLRSLGYQSGQPRQNSEF